MILLSSLPRDAGVYSWEDVRMTWETHTNLSSGGNRAQSLAVVDLARLSNIETRFCLGTRSFIVRGQV